MNLSSRGLGGFLGGIQPRGAVLDSCDPLMRIAHKTNVVGHLYSPPVWNWGIMSAPSCAVKTYLKDVMSRIVLKPSVRKLLWNQYLRTPTIRLR